MKKIYFSALIFCGLFATAQTTAQSSGSSTISDGGKQGPAATFSAYPESKSNLVKISWNTTDEANIDHFVVEHSSDSLYFTPLHELVARGGVVEGQTYADADSYPAAEENYYRLLIVSKDGNTFYSPIIGVDMSGKKMPALTPTVLNRGATLRVSEYFQDPVMINFFNESGMKIAAYMVNSTSFTINTSGWGKGIIFYRISDATHPLIDAGKIMVL